MLSGGRPQLASKQGVDSPLVPSRWKWTAHAGGASMVRSACAMRLVMEILRCRGAGLCGEDASYFTHIYTSPRESNTLVTPAETGADTASGTAARALPTTGRLSGGQAPAARTSGLRRG